MKERDTRRRPPAGKPAGGRGRRGATRPERARRGERQNAEGERNHEGRKEAETHTEHGGGRKTRQKPPAVERPGAPAQHPATGTCWLWRDGGGDPRAFRTRSARPQARATIPSSTRPPHQFKRRQPLTDNRPVKGGVSRRRRSGLCPLTGPRACAFSRGGCRAVGAGGQRETSPGKRWGWGPIASLGAGETHCPHTDEARTTAGILLRRHAGRRHGSAGRTTHTKRQKAQRKDPPSGAHKCNEAIITIKNRAGSLRLRPCYGIM